MFQVAMKRLGVAVVVLLAVRAFAQQVPADQLLREFRGEAPARQRSEQQLTDDYLAAMRLLCPKLAADSSAQGSAYGALEAMCHHAARQGAEAQRLAICKAMAQCLTSGDVEPQAKIWMMRQVENIGRDEVIEALSALLNDSDVRIFARAVAALQNNPGALAAERLRAALASAQPAPRRIALLNALGARHDAPTVPVAAKLLSDGDSAVVAAAGAALAQIGDHAAAEALLKAQARPGAAPALQTALTDDCLVCAEKLAASGQRQEALAVYQQVHDSAARKHQKVAAVRGLILTLPEDRAVATIAQALDSDDAEMQSAAGRAAVEMPGPQASRVLAEKLPALSSKAQNVVIRALAERGDAIARPAVTAAVRSADPAVRIAALDSLAMLGDSSSVAVLARAAAAANGAEKDAARQSLARLRGPEVDSTIITVLAGTDADTRVELLRAVQIRKTNGANSLLLNLFAADPNENVRTEALAALGILGTARELEALLAAIINPRSAAEAQRMEAAIGVIVSRISDVQERSAALLAALPTARGEARLSICRLLGRSATPRAMEALRKLLDDPDAETQLAAVRALADWPDAEVAPALLEVASASQKENHRVLALRGYCRVIGLPSERPAADTAKLFARAMDLARPQEKKLVLAGISAVPTIESLRLVEPCLDDEALRDEAALAAIAIARGLEQTEPAAAEAVITKVLDVCRSEKIREQAGVLLRSRISIAEFIVDWLACGPFTQDNKEGRDLFDIAFPPEKPDAKIKWVRVPIAGYIINFDQSEMAGDQRCAYVKTRIWSPGKQQAYLDVGSDDGIKVWLNGAVVVSTNTDRGHAPAQDRAKITLNEGWNALLMKVTNSAGGWQASARLRGPDEKRIENLKVKAE